MKEQIDGGVGLKEKIDGGGIFDGVWVGRWAWILICRKSCGCGRLWISCGFLFYFNLPLVD